MSRSRLFHRLHPRTTTVASLLVTACTGDPAPAEQPLGKEPAKQTPATQPDSHAKAPTPSKFRKGQLAPPGLSKEQLAEYNAAQGDPVTGDFTLEHAFEGDAKLADKDAGKLFASIETDMGVMHCELFEDKTPLTVANFVGLARATRPWYDKKADKWDKKPYFDGNLFHRVVKDFMNQTGDPTGSGTGGPGYLIVDEIDPSLEHNKGGILSMANRGKNTGNGQFFVTVRATPHLNGKHAVFGQCDTEVAMKINKVDVKPELNDRPVEPIRIKSVTFERRKK